MRRLLVLALLVFAPAITHAGGYSIAKSALTASQNEGLFWIGVPDIQNYCSSWNPAADTTPPEANRAEGIRQLRMMTLEIIAEKPEFVIQVGDIADTMGGVDENVEAGYLDDPNWFSANPNRYYGELQCSYDNFFKLLEDAGIPVLWVAGNHDSCVDLERIMPAATFLSRSYGFHVNSRASRCSAALLTDTMQRTAKVSTSIGTICIVGARYDGTENDATDIAWVNAEVGCGGSFPTILVTHYDGPMAPFISTARYGVAANSEVFAGLDGHITPVGLDTNMATAVGGHQLAEATMNWQESSLSCGLTTLPAGNGRSMHTGVGWYVKFRLVPRLSLIEIQARSPVLGGVGSNLACNFDNSYDSGSLIYSPTICSRFPTLKGC